MCNTSNFFFEEHKYLLRNNLSYCSSHPNIFNYKIRMESQDNINTSVVPPKLIFSMSSLQNHSMLPAAKSKAWGLGPQCTTYVAHRRVTLSGPKNNIATYTDVVARERVSLIFDTLERDVNSDI